MQTGDEMDIWTSRVTVLFNTKATGAEEIKARQKSFRDVFRQHGERHAKVVGHKYEGKVFFIEIPRLNCQYPGAKALEELIEADATIQDIKKLKDVEKIHTAPSFFWKR